MEVVATVETAEVVVDMGVVAMEVRYCKLRHLLCVSIDF